MRGMVNISEHIVYWKKGAVEDLDVANQLVNSGKTRHGLFFAHLSLEKILKAHVCKATQQIAPKLHNLVRLAQQAGMNLSSDHLDILSEMNAFNLEGRYPVSEEASMNVQKSQSYLTKITEVFEWLNGQL
jgi:HEPN domain-containing protein